MPPAELDVLHVDDSLLVLHKPSGLLSVPGRGEAKQDCLSARAQSRYPDALIVHRLDMATSGLMLLARGAAAQRSLNAAFAGRMVSKRYLAVVDGLISPPAKDWDTIDLPIIVDWPNRPRRIIDTTLGKPSQTRWRLLSHNALANTSRLELEPVTGRSHQLRVHLQAIGHAILGDALYAEPQVLALSPRLLLHASALVLTHPVTGAALLFSSEADF
ncbi:MAG: tRNA pseudouridine32 synthase/23S rRNA pseudouridine746 synthase [Rhodoferax sp.]|jgi:tRNA pseudouridine32 synthase/23S rRNA pseudouridine746 synthase